VAVEAGLNSGDVIIVGGGPVGMGLAIDLALRGVRSTVVERASTLHRIPKGQNLTQRTGEHFRAWGVSREIRDASPIPHAYGSAGVTAYGTFLGGYSYDWFRRGAVNQFYFAENERLPQYDTERVLRARAAQLDAIEVLYDRTVTGVSQDGDGVTVEFVEDGKTRALRAPYAVGCDGSRSLVREAEGIEQDVDPHDRLMVLLVFRSKELHDLLERYPGKSIYNVLKPELDGYWQFLGRVDLGETWFYHAPVPMGTTAENTDFTAHLHAAVGATIAVEFDHIGFWDLRIAVARTYRNGRVFIAGDAAHSHPPYGGYGVNTGFDDIRNLGWKLAGAIAGWAGPGLLDSYSLERQPVFQSTAEHFIGRMIRDDRDFVRNFSPDKDKDAFEAEWARRASGGNADVTDYVPNYAGSPIVWGPDGARCGAQGEHRMTARAGFHLAPQALSSGRDLFDALGSGFALISLDGDPAVASAFQAAASEHGVPFTVIADSRDGGREAYEAAYVLVRPDLFVAWAGDETEGNEAALLARSVGA